MIGDILHSRVARSNIHLLSKFGARITLCGPAMWLPRELESSRPASAVFPASKRHSAAPTSSWLSESSRSGCTSLLFPRKNTFSSYQFTPARLRLANPNAIVLHPGPMIRGLEIDPAVADSLQSCILEQVTNGLAIRMAILFELIAGSGEPQEQTKDSPHAAH